MSLLQLAEYSRGQQRAIVAQVCSTWVVLVGHPANGIESYRIHWEPDEQTSDQRWFVFASESQAHGAAMRWQARGDR